MVNLYEKKKKSEVRRHGDALGKFILGKKQRA